MEASGRSRWSSKIDLLFKILKNHFKIFSQFASKSFEVRKDLRPIFEVVLTTSSPTVAYRDGSIKVKIKIKVKVKSSIIGTSGFTGTINAGCAIRDLVIFQKSQRIEDETIVEFDFKNELQLPEISGSNSFLLLVDYIDDATNKTFSAMLPFTVEMSDYRISIVHSPQFFKPGIPYRFTLLVTRVDGYPVLNSKFPVEVSVNDNDGFTLVYGNFSLDPNTGAVEVEAAISVTAANLTIKAKYDRVKYSQTVYKTRSLQKDFVSINVLTPR